MKLAFKIAVRFLTSSKWKTILIAVGIAVGVSVQIFIGSLIQGPQNGLIDKTIGNSFQITILSKNDDKTISDWVDKVKIIEKSDERIKNISVSADSPGFLKYGDKVESILLRGFNLDDANKIYDIKDRIIDGNAEVKENEILMGKDLKEILWLNLMDKVIITSASGNKEEVIIVGFYDLKVATVNKTWIITNLKTAQNLFDFGDKVTFIEMQVNSSDVFIADEISKTIEGKLPVDEVKIGKYKTNNY